MNYLVIDLEMCKVPKDYRNKNYKYASEIIQIGAVLLDERYRRRDEICLYVHPEHRTNRTRLPNLLESRIGRSRMHRN